ncbi:MAG TPA: hypothetical protein VKV17_20565 [Bryobacteraceae bacterium]|nr:hypothetical protein [Bryobacteraceae bacterium]
MKGAPYSADVSTEINRTLADGNKIHQIVTERLYRDSEGRTRRETSLTGIGIPAPPGGGPELAFIDDPVAGASYVLDLGAHTATRMPWRAPKSDGPLRRQLRVRAQDFNRKVESLARQTIAGLPADGTRITQTIPAGQIGNTLPIQVVTERWYSPDLQTVILEKRSDPRSGDYIYQWTNIIRAEPPASLFSVPADFPLSQALPPGGRARGKRAQQ